MEVYINEVYQENSEIKFTYNNEVAILPVVAPAKIEYAKVGKADITVKEDQVTYIKSLNNSFQSKPKTFNNFNKSNSFKQNNYPQNNNDEDKQRLIVRQHTQKVACDILNNVANINEAHPEINEDTYLSKLLEIAHKLEEDIFRS